MNILKELRRSLLLSIWFMVLTFPIMVIRVNTITNTIEWRWERLILIGIGSFVGSWLWNYSEQRKIARMQQRRAAAQSKATELEEAEAERREAGTAPLNPTAAEKT